MAETQISLRLTAPLSMGSRGDSVKALQKLLNEALPGKGLTPDGKFGAKTHEALKVFQRKNGLVADGVVGPKTAKAMNWTYHGRNTKPYYITYEKPPLPEVSQPMVVLMEAIHNGMDPFHGSILALAQSSGATPEKITNALSALDDPAQTGLLEGLREFPKVRFSQIESNLLFLRSDVFVSYQITCLKIGVYLKDHGGKLSRFQERVIQLPVDNIVDIVKRVLKGEQETTMAVASINLSFQLLNAAKIAIPPVPRPG